MEHPLPYPESGRPESLSFEDQAKGAKIYTDPELFIKNGFVQDPMTGCELLYNRYYQNLCSYAVKLVFSRETAEDIVSEVFFDFWKNKLYQQVHTAYAPYLYRAVRNRAYSHLKKQLLQGQPIEDAEDNTLAENDTPEEIFQFHELSQRLDAVIQALPSQSRRAFILNRFEGKKYQVIAMELQISQKAVEHLIGRALKRLRAQLHIE